MTAARVYAADARPPSMWLRSTGCGKDGLQSWMNTGEMTVLRPRGDGRSGLACPFPNEAQRCPETDQPLSAARSAGFLRRSSVMAVRLGMAMAAFSQSAISQAVERGSSAPNTVRRRKTA